MTNQIEAVPSIRAFHEGVALVLQPKGNWALQNFQHLEQGLATLQLNAAPEIALDGTELEALDTSGAMLLIERLAELSEGVGINLRNMQDSHRRVFELVRARMRSKDDLAKVRPLGFVAQVGKGTITAGQHVVGTITFLGEVLSGLARLLFQPSRIRWRELFVQIELAAVHAIGVVSLVTFLIGVVVAYLFAVQIEKYGGNIFIVDGLALAMSRELSPLIVAVVMAGRSGSAFTAQIGAMKLNEEIDAIRVLGLSPLDILVLPRVMALVLALPLLVFVGDIVSLTGGMMIADGLLEITPITFLERLRIAISTRHFYVGFIKAPVFALFIALIGCRMGLNVERNARSLGLNTTSTVVQSIVAVILLDAAFAVLFMELDY